MIYIICNLDLEIKLNLTCNSTEYDSIGDHIYYFFAPNSLSKPRFDILKVTNDQYKILFNLNKKSLADILNN